MTETLEQLRARRKKDRAITRKANKLREELLLIGTLAVEARRDPTLFNLHTTLAAIDRFIEGMGE